MQSQSMHGKVTQNRDEYQVPVQPGAAVAGVPRSVCPPVGARVVAPLQEPRTLADHPIPPAVVAAARAAAQQWTIPASVSLAQWALESGWGAHMPGNNPFGIKAMPGHPVQTFATHECIHGHLVPCEQRFAAFASLDQAFDCHARLLATAPVYHAAFAALPDTRQFVALMAPHYATAPDYAAKILAVIDSAGLERYDQPAGSAPPG
jgi:hypothetical protein